MRCATTQVQRGEGAANCKHEAGHNVAGDITYHTWSAGAALSADRYRVRRARGVRRGLRLRGRRRGSGERGVVSRACGCGRARHCGGGCDDLDTWTPSRRDQRLATRGPHVGAGGRRPRHRGERADPSRTNTKAGHRHCTDTPTHSHQRQLANARAHAPCPQQTLPPIGPDTASPTAANHPFAQFYYMHLVSMSVQIYRSYEGNYFFFYIIYFYNGFTTFRSLFF